MLVALLVVSAVSSVTPSLQAVGSPEWLLNKFYSDSVFIEKSEYITGEFAEHYSDEPTMGALLRGQATVTHRRIQRDTSSAIYATAIRTENSSQDYYTYLILRDGRWKISAVRTLATDPSTSLSSGSPISEISPTR